MIPADHIIINGDFTAAFVKHTPGHVYDRPCDTCDGCKHLCVDGVNNIPCPDCDDTGRHTSTVEVENLFDKHTDWVFPVRTLIVHVIDVLEIVAKDIRVKAPERYIYVLADGRAWLVEGDTETPITLPPAAEPGMWLVRLAVHV